MTKGGIIIPDSVKKPKGQKDNSPAEVSPGDEWYAIVVAVGALPPDYKLELKPGDKVVSVAKGSPLTIDERALELMFVQQIDGKFIGNEKAKKPKPKGN